MSMIDSGLAAVRDRCRRPAAVVAAVLTSLGALAGSAAAEVELFRANDRDTFLAGTFDGVSLDPTGALALGARVDRLATLDEAYVFAAARHPRGWVVGTGNGGRVLLIDRQGRVETLFTAAEPEVFAVLADDQGTVYAGTSPSGKVYKIPPHGGDVEVVMVPEATYVWDLAYAADGALLVATGLPGRLYRLGTSGDAELLVDTGDRHLRTVAQLPAGALLLGTAGQGLVLRRAADGSLRTLHDAAHPEVLAFAVDPEGTAYAALLASEASQVDLSAARNGESDEEEGEEGAVSVTIGQATVGSRGAGFTGPRSVLLAIAPDGGQREIWAFEDETVHALAWYRGALWVGTGEEGRLYRWADDVMVLEKDLDQRQITALVVDGAGGAAAVTTNAAALYHLPGAAEASGTYTSAVLDAGQVARFGAFFWRGRVPRGGRLELSFRSGMAQTPDATWSAWSAPVRGEETALAGRAPEGRYVQWRAAFHGGVEGGPRLESVELSYRQRNQRPRIERLEVLDPGQVVVANNFNPQSQTYEPWSPNRDGIFTSLAAADDGDGRTKTLWKKGYRTLRWTATDANEDALRYDLAFRPLDDGAPDAEAWLPMAGDLEVPYYSFDATVLPDGLYRFRVTASDRDAHAAGGALEGARVSPPVVIDHAPPALGAVRRAEGGVVEVEARDALSPLRDAVVSVDGGAWRPAPAIDGLLDGRREVLRLSVPAEARLLLLRLTDAAWNVVTFDLSASR